MCQIFYILLFCLFMGPQSCFESKKMAFFGAKIANFAQKMPLLATLRSHKKTKKQNIKNLTHRKFLNITRIIYTKNWTNRANIEGVGNFLRSWGMHFFAEKMGKKRFFGRKWSFFGKCFQKFGNQ